MSGASKFVDWLRPLLVAIPLAGLILGLAAFALGYGDVAAWIYTLATLPVIAALSVEIATSLMQRETGLDIVALLAMGGAVILGEPLAGVVVALMYAGGQFLESYALRRARREMRALLERAPRTAMRYGGGALAEVPVETLKPGDRILVRQGDVVPVDGTVAGSAATLDQSALTGESLPVGIAIGGDAMSGATNAGAAFDLIAARPAAESTYAAIVRLVEAAARDKARIVRLADRYALAFLAVTLVIALGAWAASGDPTRWLAVMVVATPCPLILAVPVAVIAGVSRAAKIGVLIKGGGALESMARATTLVIDKTGTLTRGRAALSGIRPRDGFDGDELLRLAASLDQASGHVLAAALIAAAGERKLTLTPPEDVAEVPGSGLTGRVGGRAVIVGGAKFVTAQSTGGDAAALAALPGEAVVAVAVDGAFAGTLIFADPLRPEAKATLDAFRANGVKRIILASGDEAAVSRAIAEAAGADIVEADLTPEDKLAVVAREADGRNGDDDRRRGERRAGAGERYHRRRDGRARGGGGIGGGGRGAAGRPHRPGRGRHGDRAPLAGDRAAERVGRPRAVVRGDDRGGARISAADPGGAVPGSDRRCRDPQRAPGARRTGPGVAGKETVFLSTAGELTAPHKFFRSSLSDSFL